MKSNPENSIKKIKRILHLDYHHCNDCDWFGKMRSLISSSTKKAKSCPSCKTLQFSKKDPTLRERIEQAESLYYKETLINSSTFESKKSDESILISKIIDIYYLDEDGINEFIKRISPAPKKFTSTKK